MRQHYPQAINGPSLLCTIERLADVSDVAPDSQQDFVEVKCWKLAARTVALLESLSKHSPISLCGAPELLQGSTFLGTNIHSQTLMSALP